VHLAFTEEQEELRSAVRSVLAKECPASLPRSIVEGTGDADGLWARMVGLDWPALTVPEADGGIGYGFVELAVLVEELGRVIAPGPLFATATQFVPFVRECGTPEQRAALLGPVATGAVTGTVAVAELPMGWNLDGVQATLRADGDNRVLNGTKHHVLSPEVDHVAVVARLESGELAVAIVPTTSATVERIDPLDKTRPVGHLTFSKVAVPADRVLLGGTAAVTRALEEATVAMALETLGTCQAIFEVTLQYAKDREQFGVPIGSFQAVKHRLADCYMQLERARALCYFATACLAEDDPRRAEATAMAKAAAGDCQRFVAAEGIQLLGGIAYTWEQDQHLWVKRAMTGDLLFGRIREQRTRLAEILQPAG
jgi:alkylation response protein AidB-like acyl-CoA dehydrogenase